MFNVIRFILYVFLFVSSPLITYAASETSPSYSYMDGNKLKDALNPSSPLHEVAMGYVSGITDILYIRENRINGFRACLPSAPVQQMMDVTQKYLNDHPEKLHLGASGLIAKALFESFPCK
jgi:hypothetical protein